MSTLAIAWKLDVLIGFPENSIMLQLNMCSYMSFMHGNPFSVHVYGFSK